MKQSPYRPMQVTSYSDVPSVIFSHKTLQDLSFLRKFPLTIFFIQVGNHTVTPRQSDRDGYSRQFSSCSGDSIEVFL